MSVNCCKTKCPECNIWDFESFSVNTAESLLSIDEYLSMIGSGRDRSNDNYGFGHGYWKRTPSVAFRYSDGVYSSYERPGKTLLKVHEFTPVQPDPIYGWIKSKCPLCNTHLALWMTGRDGLLCNGDEYEPIAWECTDLSYFWSFNDEPGQKDISDRVEVNRKLLIQAWQEFSLKTAQEQK